MRDQVEHVMRHGPDSQCKAVMQALGEEVRVVSRDEIVPTFRVPDDNPAAQVRIDDGVVGRVL